MTVSLASLGASEVVRRLAGGGVVVRTGPFAMRMKTRLPQVARSIHALYGAHPLAPEDAFIDFDVEVRRHWHWPRPVVKFHVEGDSPFNPLPADQGFPLLEWGMNWCVYSMCHQYLILHAAVLERHGRALLMPAPSGSGKSTLCAALALSGWRLLSDELALIDPATGALVPVPRPVSLKNESIDVISRFAPGLSFGSVVHETSKGVVAHFAPPAEAIEAADSPVLPGWVVFPSYRPGHATELQPMPRSQAVIGLAQNAFNYDVYGREGFDLLCQLAGRSHCHEFIYSDLREAVARFETMAEQTEPMARG